jgi:hypothetical protein
VTVEPINQSFAPEWEVAAFLAFGAVLVALRYLGFKFRRGFKLRSEAISDIQARSSPHDAKNNAFDPFSVELSRFGLSDWIEVGRTAHELADRHGRNAYAYAKKLADAAKAEGRDAEADFWVKVSATVRQRYPN